VFTALARHVERDGLDDAAQGLRYTYE